VNLHGIVFITDLVCSSKYKRVNLLDWRKKMVSFEHQLKKSESILRQSRKAYEKRSSATRASSCRKGKRLIFRYREKARACLDVRRRVDMFYGDIKFVLWDWQLRYEKEFSFLFKRVHAASVARRSFGCGGRHSFKPPERSESKFILRRTLFNRLKEQEHKNPNAVPVSFISIVPWKSKW